MERKYSFNQILVPFGVESIARKILEAMNEGLMLQHHLNVIAQTSESSRLLDHKAQNFGPTEGMIQQSRMNRTPKLIWKPATKHLDGKVWEIYFTDSYDVDATCIDGKIVIHEGYHPYPPQGLGNLFKLVESFFSRRRDAEADYIGLLLMAAAGYDPQVAPDVYKNLDSNLSDTYLFSTHHSGEKRAKLLKDPKTNEQAKQIYEDVKAGYGVRSFV
ncbi:hypothetical protein DITRI_Ditri11bG0162600 [Diplodiscus trichospermus]